MSGMSQNFAYMYLSRVANIWCGWIIRLLLCVVEPHSLRVPAMRHDFAIDSITYRFPKIFNSMPLNIKEKIYSHSFIGFKIYVKNHFIQSYSSVCNLPNCYICSQ